MDYLYILDSNEVMEAYSEYEQFNGEEGLIDYTYYLEEVRAEQYYEEQTTYFNDRAYW